MNHSSTEFLQGGPRALTLLRFGHIVSLVLFGILCTSVVFLWNRSSEKGSSKQKNFMSVLGPFDEKCPSAMKCVKKQQFFLGDISHRPPCSPHLSPLDFFFLWNELKTQPVQHPAPANPAELRALLTHVYQRTWTGTRWMFEKIGAARVRKFTACVAAKRSFPVAKTSFITPWHSPQTQTTPTFPKWAPPDPQMGLGPLWLPKKP